MAGAIVAGLLGDTIHQSDQLHRMDKQTRIHEARQESRLLVPQVESRSVEGHLLRNPERSNHQHRSRSILFDAKQSCKARGSFRPCAAAAAVTCHRARHDALARPLPS
eukprot:2834822-Rhodomonas_salina.1